MNLIILLVLLFDMMAAVAAAVPNDPAGNQTIRFKENTQCPIAIMTTGSGAPIDCKQTVTLNKRLIFNQFFMEFITHFDRERIPERVVHAKGAGAFGYFEVTHDVTDICKAKLFSEVGKRTPIAARFSAASGERGAKETSRELRGFAIKFYTEEGNFDIVGLNSPMYAYKDPILFPSFARVQKRNPATNLMDNNMLWDFMTLHPEVLHVFFILFGDRGIPRSHRFMPGFSIHTYQVVNENGDKYFVRFHFYPDLGIKNLLSEEAKIIGAEDPDYATRDLYDAIAKGDYPSWSASIQVLSLTDIQTAGFDVFDITKVLPLDKYPLRPLGRIVLNQNPVNHFAEIEQLALSPMNLVPGILGAPDKVFEARCLSYRDSQYHRLGANFLNIPVNCPLQTKTFTYDRDGAPPLKCNMRDIPNYYPNSFNGPIPYVEQDDVELIEIYEDQPNNFEQARDLYVNGMTAEEKQRLVENILYSLGPVTKFLQERAVERYALIDIGLSEKIRQGLANCTVD